MHARREWVITFCRTLCIFHLLVGLASLAEATSISDWIWGSGEKEIPNSPDSCNREVKNGFTMPEVKFESLSNDDRFLQEAQYFGLAPTSQLDSCQQTVVLRLKASCSSLSEEQLAKLSVALLNCQSAAEGRPQFPCSDDMTLRECTGDMDPDTWNTYHLMNNRARAVCLASRQAQFRVLTEMAVNKLMNTARGQIDAMNVLQEEQERLGTLTEGTMKTLNEGQQKLLFQQQNLRAAQRNAHSFVAHSLQELAREKSIVAAGHRELARLAQNIKQKLDGAETDLQQQGKERREQHAQLLSDLQSIQTQASVIWEDIEKSTYNILQRQEIALQHYEQTLTSLNAINNTLLYLQNVLETTRLEVDQRLGWIADTLGGAGGQLDLVISCLLHVGFLLMGMLTVAFLGAPMCTKVLLLLLASLNLLQLVWQGPNAALSLPATALLIVVGTGVHMLINALHHVVVARPPVASIQLPSQLVNGSIPTSTTNRTSLVTKLQSTVLKLWTQLKILVGIDSDDHAGPALSNGSVPVPSRPIGSGASQATRSFAAFTSTAQHQSSSEEEEDEDVVSENISRTSVYEIQQSRMLFRESTPRQRSRSGTPAQRSSPRPTCSATCLNGQPCRLAASSLSGLCYRHARQTSNTPH